MLLKTIKSSSLTAWQYMERYVNRGSESGFDKVNQSLPSFTSAYSEQCCYPMNVYDCRILKTETLFANDAHDILQPNEFVFHPGNIILSKDNELLRQTLKSFTLIMETQYTAIPTASSRTVFINNSSDKCLGFLKLHYDGLIGRVNRAITKQQALSSIELTKVITDAMNKAILPRDLYFFKEPFAKVVYNGTYEMSYIYRELKPYPYDERLKYIIPMFSLFSIDKCAPSDKTLLQQLFEAQNKPIEDFLLDKILLPIFKSYFELLLTLGLQPEWQAQNVLLGIDENYDICGIVFRDLESVDKDIELMKSLTFYHNKQYPFFESYDYKCIWYNYRPYTNNSYQIKHSFMFDFKLCRYLVLPIIEAACSFCHCNKDRLEKVIAEFNQQYLLRLPLDFFPQNCWYNYANVVLDRSLPRPFIANSDVKFR